MIISHKHRFIFIKTKKTAGTSLEIALSKFCGREDVITPLTKEDERKRKRLGVPGARNYGKRMRDWGVEDWAYFFIKRKEPPFFFNHIKASHVKRFLNKDIWENYLKFTVVRNPWEKMVSQYNWRRFQTGKNFSFSEFLLRNPDLVPENWFIYANFDEPILDYYVRFENLGEDLSKISSYIGIEEDLNSLMNQISSKNINKSRDRISPFRVGEMDRFDSELISYLADKEISKFGYSFLEN